MPILSKEPDIFPADLFSSPATNCSCAWWVLDTKSRREKDLSRRLRKLQIPHFAPVVKRRTRSASGGVCESFVHLFPGNVFVAAGGKQRDQAVTTNCVSRCLPVSDTAQLVHDLRQIQQRVQSEAPLTPEDRIVPGTCVRVCSGPLLGFEGFVQQRRGERQLAVAIELLLRVHPSSSKTGSWKTSILSRKGGGCN